MLTLFSLMSGVQKWTDGSVYVGTFKDDLKHGIGLYRWPNREVHMLFANNFGITVCVFLRHRTT